MQPDADTKEQGQHVAEDGSVYSAGISLQETERGAVTYTVDLVRTTSVGDDLRREHRLPLGEHKSWMEAEEQLREVEEKLGNRGLVGWGEIAQELLELPDSALTVGEYEAVRLPTTPLFDPAAGTVRHVDGGGTAHWFAVVERDEQDSEPYELRYFRALDQANGVQISDSYPVMPLPDDDPGSVWPLPGLEMYLQKGDVYMAQRFACDVAEAHGYEFPDPLELPALDPRPEYYFGYGIGPDNDPSLEAVKTWMDGGERRFDTLTVGEYGMFDEAAVDERELETLLETEGVEAAMNVAERMAVAGGYLDPERSDPRMFSEDDAPPDPFTTNRARELAPEPVYSFDYNLFGDNALALEAHKTWPLADGTHGRHSLVLDLRQGEGDGAVEHFESEIQRLTDLMVNSGVETAMNEAERMAVVNGLLKSDRDDARLFKLGPSDPFTTNRARELETGPAYQVHAISAGGFSHLDVVKRWGEDGYERLTIPQRDWEEAQANAETALDMLAKDDLQGAMTLIEVAGIEAGVIDPERDDPRLFTQGPPDPFATIRERQLAAPGMDTDELPAVEGANPYWRLDTLPVANPDGEPLGYAVQMVVYPGVAHDPEAVGSPDIPDDEPFRMLEVAHFETADAADKFGREFGGYLMPGLLEGPELAEEVARLEGHPVDWKTLEGQELEDYRDLKLTRDPADWHPYNPNAERDARLAAEGLDTEPIHQYTTFVEDEDQPKVEPAAPNFDL